MLLHPGPYSRVCTASPDIWRSGLCVIRFPEGELQLIDDGQEAVFSWVAETVAQHN